jgi:sucrose phosphorylase
MNKKTKKQQLPNGVMFNAYPDSIGKKLSDTVELLERFEFKDAFSLFYILPTFFHSDLDRGFSIIDYDINEELVSQNDLDALQRLGIQIKLDLVLNHLSVRSPQFLDLLKKGNDSPYRDFFIDWNEFWKDHGVMGLSGHVVPDDEYLNKLFMRKPGLPILKVRFPDGTLKPYWNTFYQKVDFEEITARDFADIKGIDIEEAEKIAHRIKILIKDKDCLESIDLKDISNYPDEVLEAICHKRDYLGQMDLNARSKKVWKFYDKTLKKLSDYGAKIIRLDAFAYLHKEPGQPNFFNRPGTWDYLERLRKIAEKYNLIIFPEIHSEYGAGIHEEIAQKGYPIYDFFFPGLVIHALESGDNQALLKWVSDIQTNGLLTINMLGCHDGIPVMDLKGKTIDDTYYPGLLSDDEIDSTVDLIIERGGRTKNLYDANGKKIDYYQVNATFFSALGEDEKKLVLARAIQMFMPGIPQVWYLDLFAGTNDYAAADKGRTAGHKEINRTTLELINIEDGLKRPVVLNQLKLIKLRNTSPVFKGKMTVVKSEPHEIHFKWKHKKEELSLKADLKSQNFTIMQKTGSDKQAQIFSQ